MQVRFGLADIRRMRAWYLGTAALCAPLLKVAGFLTGHKLLIPTEAGLPNDSVTLVVNMFAMAGSFLVVALLVLLFGVLPAVFPFRKAQDKNTSASQLILFWMLDLMFTALIAGGAYEVACAVDGMYRVTTLSVGALLAAARWIPASARELARGKVICLAALVITAVGYVAIFCMIRVVPYEMEPITNFGQVYWMFAMIGLTTYALVLSFYYRRIVQKNPFRQS